MFKTGNRITHGARKAGDRRVVGVAGRPLKLSRHSEMKARHAVRQRPRLHERLAARVKHETRRLEPPRDLSPAAVLPALARQVRDALVPNDPRDVRLRAQSGEPVVALVGAVDLVLFLVIAMLLVVGLVMVYSASMPQAYLDKHSTSYYLFRQTGGLLIGGIGMYVAMRLDYHRWRYVAGVGLVVSFLLLLLALRFGVDINGARRWIGRGSLQIQPSEIAKIAVVLYAAHWFAGQRPALRHSLRGLIPFALVVGLIIALVFKEPDLGTALVIAFALLTVYFVSGARLWHLALLAIVAVIGVKLYMHHLPAYQAARFQAFLDPYKYPKGGGLQYVQMLNALGTGGPTGVGLGQSPGKITMINPDNDSIFSVIGEELGLVGTVGVLVLFGLFALRGMRASILAPDPFGRLLAAGLTCSIVFQGLLNMAVVAHVVPLTGVPLPFISYGDTSLVLSMVAAGILLNISKQAVDPREERDPASSYLWWRNRRPHLSVAGRRALSHEQPAVGRQPSNGSRQRSAVSHQPSAAGSRRAAGR